MVQRVLYVDPVSGQDSRDGLSASRSLKTLSTALRLSQADTQIRLQGGLYSAANGEQFPLVIPTGCQIIGTPGRDRPATIFQGSGRWQSSNQGVQAVTCVLREDATLRSVTLMNPTTQGIGLWLEVERCYVQNIVVVDCTRHGGFVSGSALPTIEDSVFEQCGQAGIVFANQGKGQLERVTCRQNDIGILLQDTAAPLLQQCRIENNRIGLEISDTANPVLRRNQVINNQTYGVSLTAQATADLGLPQDVGENVVRYNGQGDIRNQSRRSLVTCGNDLIPQRLQGDVELVASELPDPSAVPASLFSQPAREPGSDTRGSVEADPENQQPRGDSRFSDAVGHWASPFIEGLAAVGGIKGFEDGTFRPDELVTRAQFAAFAMGSFAAFPEKVDPVSFKDVSRNFWAAKVLAQAQVRGFLSGYPDGTVRPNVPLSRIQAIVALSNGLGLGGGRADDVGIYRDRAQIPSYAIEALAAATRRQLVVNYPDPLTLRPSESITRAEVAALIYQGRVIIGTATALSSPYIVQPDATQPLFSDIDGHWAAAFIRGLATANLVTGLPDGRFAPEAPMNRAQFATLIVNAFQPQSERTGTLFQDVPGSFWAAAPIQTAYRGGFMSGFPDQTFGPENPLLRVQIWVALVNGLDWENLPVELNPLGRFIDYDRIPRYALQMTAIALAKQLLINYPDANVLRPNQVATRAEVSATVYQAMVALGRLPAIESRYIA